MADNASAQGQSLADSVTNMATQLPGGPAAGAVAVVKGVASSIHKAVDRFNNTNQTDGSKPAPTYQADHQDWSGLQADSNLHGQALMKAEDARIARARASMPKN